MEVLDTSVLLLREHWVQLYSLSLAGTVPIALLLGAFVVWTGRLFVGTGDEVFIRGTLTWSAAMSLAWCWLAVARTGVSSAALAIARGTPAGTTAAWRRAVLAAGATLPAALAAFSGAWLLGAFLAVPGLAAAFGWWLARPVGLDEGKSWLSSLKRSSELMAGHRSRAAQLWLLILAAWGLGVLNLHLLTGLLLDVGSEFLGTDTSGLKPLVQLNNVAYVTILAAVLFILLDPLKTVADVLLYLDVKVRREGADLQLRLNRISAGAAALAWILLAPGPAGAESLEAYRQELERVRQVLAASRTPREFRRAAVELPGGVVELRSGAKLTVEQDELRAQLRSWRTPEDRRRLLSRLDALERTLGRPERRGGNPREVDAAGELRQILQEPEFLPLAERPELAGLMERLDLSKTDSWWASFWNWIKGRLFQPGQVNWNFPNWRLPELSGIEWVLYSILAGLLLYLVARLLSHAMHRKALTGVRRAPVPERRELAASHTENALDHPVDAWEEFARDWLQRGEIRQAVRALYLASLVHLHQDRRINYHRALTNWTYVRQFRGAPTDKEVLSSLTRMFDEFWYGDRPCEEGHYREFERGVRALGTPAPAGAGESRSPGVGSPAVG